jgi:hypothetical protein
MFTTPFGPIVPGAAIAIALLILAGATRANLVAGAAALAAGTLVYWMAKSRISSSYSFVPRSPRR